MKKQSFQKIFLILKKEYPQPDTVLKFGNPLQIMVATILSAQCTDKRVNIITKNLFKKYKTVKDYANASQKEFEIDIKSSGFYKNKAKNIINACKMIIKKFDGKVPDTMGELIKLPGVARKTANVVLSHAYGVVEGMAVDTHVTRLSQRIGLSKNKDPNKIEQDLLKLVPKNYWDKFSLSLIWHGRKVCNARKPKCSECKLNKLCESAFKV
ncbi:endonuclease III [Candidatus Woesearchaeota archaeon]|nr:endonuclease III [Candidatus Woesearchaeota archaeon]